MERPLRFIEEETWGWEGPRRFEIPGQVGKKSKGDFRWRTVAALSPRQFGQDRSRTTAKNDRTFGSPSKRLFLHITPLALGLNCTALQVKSHGKLERPR